MKVLRALLFFIGAIAVATRGLAAEVPAYRGSDAGYVTFAIAARSPIYLYRLQVRRKGESSDQYFEWQAGSLLFGPKPDFRGSNESGKVITHSMPPGDYEIYNFLITHTTSYGVTRWWSRKDFSIPFTIKPGETAYLGNFSSIVMKGKNLFGLDLADGAYFLVSDRSARDIPIAKAKKDIPIQGAITPAVPDPIAVNSFFFRSAPMPETEKISEPYPWVFSRF